MYSITTANIVAEFSLLFLKKKTHETVMFGDAAVESLRVRKYAKFNALTNMK